MRTFRLERTLTTKYRKVKFQPRPIVDICYSDWRLIETNPKDRPHAMYSKYLKRGVDHSIPVLIPDEIILQYLRDRDLYKHETTYTFMTDNVPKNIQYAKQYYRIDENQVNELALRGFTTILEEKHEDIQKDPIQHSECTENRNSGTSNNIQS